MHYARTDNFSLLHVCTFDEDNNKSGISPDAALVERTVNGQLYCVKRLLHGEV